MNLFPISFCIDEGKIVKETPRLKKHAFASLIPGDMSTYTFQSEAVYNQHYSDSFYAFTWKKAGWDCMRHYEIIAAGCMPFFPDLPQCPPNTMTNFPKHLILEAMALPGINVSSRTIDFTVFPIDRYYELLDQLLSYARTHLTSKVAAKRVLDICNFDASEESTTKLVYYNCRLPDYQSLMILQGLKQLLGSRCISTPNDGYLYDDFTEAQAQALPSGKGFNYTRMVPAIFKTSQEDFNRAIADPEKENITLVIFGKCHWDHEPHESLKLIEKVFICGEDLHDCHFIRDPNRTCKLFVREL